MSDELRALMSAAGVVPVDSGLHYDPSALRDLSVDPEVERLRGRTHWGQAIDVPYMSRVAGNLWQGGCATGLLLPERFGHVVSLYASESYTVRHQLQSRLAVLLYDSESQGAASVDSIAAWVSAKMDEGTGDVLVHCQAGLNRSGLVCARALMMRGLTAGDAIDAVRRARSNPDGSSASLSNPTFVQYLVSCG